MKLKKFGVLGVIGVSVVMLTACGTDNKAKFIKMSYALSKNSSQKFDMKFDNLKVKASGQYQMYEPIINGYLADLRLSGTSHIDGKNNTTTIKLNVLGQSFPFDMVMKGDIPYLKLDSLGPVVDFGLSMSSGGESVSKINTAKLKGKYLDVIAIAKESSQKSRDIPTVKPEDTKKAMEKAIKAIDKSDFTKEGSAITLNLSSKVLAKVTKTYISALPKETKKSLASVTKDKTLDTEIAKVIKSTTITVDDKKKTANAKINFTGKETNGLGLVGYVTYNFSNSDKKVKVNLPKQNNIVKTSSELNKLMSDALPSGLEPSLIS